MHRLYPALALLLRGGLGQEGSRQSVPSLRKQRRRATPASRSWGDRSWEEAVGLAGSKGTSSHGGLLGEDELHHPSYFWMTYIECQ